MIRDVEALSAAAPGGPLDYLGVAFAGGTLEDALDWVEANADDRPFRYVVTPNVNHIVDLHEAPDRVAINAAYTDAALRLCDSRVLELLASRSGRNIPVVPGSDLIAALLDRSGDVPQKIAVIGGSERLLDALRAKCPAKEWSAMFPPMGLRHDAAAREAVAQWVEASDARLFIFAVGAPQSELCCHLIQQRGRARGLALCTGAALAMFAGLVKRSPPWLRTLRLEWLHRLVQEPRRLGRRYLIEAPRIFRIALAETKVRR